MTDRELLELAAKAAKYHVRGPAWEFVATHDQTDAHLVIENDRRGDSVWNPLADDGDALRLAVKLDMQIWRGRGPTVCGMPPSGDFWKRLNEPLGDDPYAATRRAIVRAAAEIGRAM